MNVKFSGGFDGILNDIVESERRLLMVSSLAKFIYQPN